MNIHLIPVTKNSSRQHKRMFLKLINKFRAGYFADADNMGMEDLNHALANHVLCTLITANDKFIGMVEATPGGVNEQKILNVATLYIDPRHRNKGIANYVYKMLDDIVPEVDVALQIEESNYLQNVKKFEQMGFTYYWAGEIKNVQDHRKYDEKTYVLYHKQYSPELLPVAA